MSRTIFVTGATGNVGEPLVEHLAREDVDVVAGVRSREDVGALPAGVGGRIFDYENPSTWPGAFDGVDGLFVVRPPPISNVRDTINPSIQRALAAGVTHVVTLSLLGAEKNPVVPHRKIETYVEGTGVDYTHLRPSFFMQNLSTTHRAEIRDESRIVVPAGDGATSFIDCRDIADVAALALLNPEEHANLAHDLTGARALSYHDVAEVFSEVLGREIRYDEPSVFEFYRYRRSKGDPLGFLAVTVALYTVARLGLADTVTDDFERLTGQAPRSLEQFVRDYRDCWVG
ncbi:MAG: SDR family oxidoreductase [Myxococcota bacterium]